MANETDLRKLLVLSGPNFKSGDLLDSLRTAFDVHVVADLDQAIDALRDHRFDAVLADTGDFLPLERGVVTQRAAVVLDTVGDGVVVVGAGGELVWANRRAREFPREVLDPLRRLCRDAYEQFATRAPAGDHRGRKHSLIPTEGQYYEVICSPVRDSEGVLKQVAAVVVNATQQRRQQQKLNAIDRAGRELVRLDFGALSNRTAPERLSVLEDRIIRCSREVLSYQHFAVLLLDERTNRLEPIVFEGLGGDIDSYEIFAGTGVDNGISGYVAATGRSYICPDVRSDPRYKSCLPNACSSLTVPLRLHDKVIGVLNVESDRMGAFGEEDRQFAEIFAGYVAMSLHVLKLLVFERHETHTQVSGSICAQLTGPLNDILTEAAQLQEDYIGHDDLRRRLDGIIVWATQARKSLQQVSQGVTAGDGETAGPIEQDPVLTGKRILVADDEELIRQTVCDVLVPYGALVDVAADGAEAIRYLAVKQYDLVISDIKMPGASGYEVFAAAKAAHDDTAVILITAFGYDPGHSIVRANREGLSAVLFKPFKVRELLDHCRAALTKTAAG